MLTFSKAEMSKSARKLTGEKGMAMEWNDSSHAGRRSAESGRAGLTVIIVLLIAGAIIIAGIVPRMRARAELRTTTNELAVPAVSVIQPKMGAPETEIVLPGHSQAFADSPIYARTNGYLKKWYADIGTHVKQGELLAEIETPEVDQQLEQARADLSTAQANFDLAKITATRYQDLAKSESVSKQDVDNATGDFQAKKAMVESAQSNVNRLLQMQSFERIYAPFDGVVTARNTDVGHLINSGASGPANELFHIAAVNKLRVFINVPQEDSSAARPGLTADLTFQEYPGQRFKGKLVRTADSIDPASRTLLTEVDVDNEGGKLLPGAYTEVHLKAPTSTPSVVLPVTALIFRAQGLQAGLVDSNNRAQLRDIVLGRDYGNEVEVVSGLKPDDRVIVNPPDSLVNGEELRIVAPGTEGAAGAPPASEQH
jgi:RND family efflux transporter MFP subunit